MKTKEDILELNFGSDYYQLKENGHLQSILNSMQEYTKMVISEILPTDEEIKQQMTTDHYNRDKGRYRRVRLDRIQGGKMIRDLLSNWLTSSK